MTGIHTHDHAAYDATDHDDGIHCHPHGHDGDATHGHDHGSQGPDGVYAQALREQSGPRARAEARRRLQGRADSRLMGW